MGDSSLEVSKRDSYWDYNPRLRFNTTIYKNSVQREGQIEAGCCKTTGGTCSCSETSDSKRGHCSCNQ